MPPYPSTASPLFTYEYPRPAVTVDAVVFGLDSRSVLHVLLIRRGSKPHLGSWAVPGGFVELDEDLEVAARRELLEESGVHVTYLEQLYTFGKPGRDPRGHVISVAWYALVRTIDHTPVADTDATEVQWHSMDDLPELAFDHSEMVTAAHKRLQAKVCYAPVGFDLLPPKFTLRQLQQLYEGILDRPLDKRNFRRKVLAMNLLVDTDEVEQRVRHRAARLYRFDHQKYNSLALNGFIFDI